ncbi:MAG: trehalose-phosphatase [Desulfobacterales bacterium]
MKYRRELEINDIKRKSAAQRRKIVDLPWALERVGEISSWRDGKKMAVFLDYDGTLTPIVERPEQAILSASMRDILKALAKRCVVAIVSGRGLQDVRERVALDSLYYAGSHGFEIDGPGDDRIQNEMGTKTLPALDKAETDLRRRLTGVPGAQVERKRFSVAVHYRRVAAGRIQAVERIVDEVLKFSRGLRRGHGKKVFELQPDLDWNKGQAVLWLMRRLGLTPDKARPIYIGDDVTDEDAFCVLQGTGAGIVVHGGEERQTCAGYELVDPGEVQRFLQKLVEVVD